MKFRSSWFLAVCFSLNLPAADGVLEINQACALNGGCFSGDDPGFPVSIDGSAGKSYRLTSDLDLGAFPDTTAIEIDTSFVTLDLNGFEIAGPVTCTGSGASLDCGTPGSAAGVRVTTSGHEGVLIRNGTIRNMSSSGVSSAGNRTSLMQLRAYNNARNGFRSGEGSIAFDCIAARNGDNGFDFGVTSVIERSSAQGNGNSGFLIEFQRGVVTRSTARFNGNRGFELGHSARFRDNTSGFNEEPDRCGGGICTELRRYYLTPEIVYNGAQAITACDTGFHMASLFEIHDTSGWRYDSVKGFSNSGLDAGEGPPSAASGWIRTGINSTKGDNCNGWVSASGSDFGRLGRLNDPQFWGVDADDISPWQVFGASCNVTGRVWCAEDQ